MESRFHVTEDRQVQLDTHPPFSLTVTGDTVQSSTLQTPYQSVQSSHDTSIQPGTIKIYNSANRKVATDNTLASWYTEQVDRVRNDAKSQTTHYTIENLTSSRTARSFATEMSHSPHAHPKSIIHTAALQTYADYLKSYYKNKFPNYFRSHGLRFHTQKYINLALVHKENEPNHEGEPSIILQLHGKVDQILRRKSPLTIDEIGIVLGGAKAWSILIEGAPGVGKTTLSWHLCQKWSEGILLQEWSLVVLVRMRDKRAREAKCFSDLFYHPDPLVRKEICDELMSSNGADLLILFDGYDEISKHDTPYDSLFFKILNREALSEATLLVTSRPISTQLLGDEFIQSIDQHIEILGFGKQDINNYMLVALENNPALLEAFKFYLSSHPFAESAMYIPLHCSLIIELFQANWRREKGFSPKTLTQLYTSLVTTLLRCYMDEHVEYKDRKPVRELSDLPEKIHEQLMQLGKLAAEGIEKQQYIFDDIPCESLGLIKRVDELYVDQDARISYSFVHLTLHEYLAALYWSKIPERLDELLAKPHLFPLTEFIATNNIGIEEQSSSFGSASVIHWPVLLFISGLTKLESLDCSLLNIAKVDNDVDTVVSVNPGLCQVLFEAQSPELVSKLFSTGCFKPVVNTTLDAVVTGYCISCSSPQSNWEIYFLGHTHKPQHLRMLATGLHYLNKPKNGGHITRLVLDTWDQLSQCIEVLPKLHPYTQELVDLQLCGKLTFGASHTDILVQVATYYPMLRKMTVISSKNSSHSWSHLILSLPQLLYLETLYLAFVYLQDNSLEDSEDSSQLLCRPLSLCKSLKHFKLWLSNTSSDSSQLVENLLNVLVSRLQILELDFSTLNEVSTSLLSKTLQSEHCCLQRLKLGSCKINPDNLNQVLMSLTKNTSLHNLKIENCTALSQAIPSLKEVLVTNTTLKKMVIWDNSILETDVKELVQMVQSATLSQLVLHEDYELHCINVDKVCFQQSDDLL